MATLTAYRRALAQELGGDSGVFTATGGSTTTLVCAGAFKSTELPSSAYAYAWVYVPGGSGVVQRRIKRDGLIPTSGTIVLDGPLGAAVTNGTVFELHSKLPAVREPSAEGGTTAQPGLREIINLALRQLLVPDVLSLALVDGAYDYSLSAYPWLDRPERLVDIREPDVTGATTKSTWRDWELREDVDGQILHVRAPWRFSSGDYAASLQVLRPADTKIAVASVWGDSTVGLVSESDEAGPDLASVVTVAKAFAYRALRDSRPGAALAIYAALYEEQLALARRVRHYDHSTDMGEQPAAAPRAA